MRGDATRMSSLTEGKLEIPLAGLSTVIALLAVLYGLCMGSFNLLHPLDADAKLQSYDMYMQMIASGVKFPLLFFLTLLVTFPSLYVFNALIGSRPAGYIRICRYPDGRGASAFYRESEQPNSVFPRGGMGKCLRSTGANHYSVVWRLR